MAASSSTLSSSPSVSVSYSTHGLTVRAENDFKALPALGEPGGTTPDSQYFLEVATDKIWIGKCGFGAMTSAEAWARTAPNWPRLMDEYLECLGAALYGFFNIPCAETALSHQKPVPHKVDVYGGNSYLACPHVMSKMVENFHLYTELLPQLELFSPFELYFAPDLTAIAVETLPEGTVVILENRGNKLRCGMIENHQLRKKAGTLHIVERDISAYGISEMETQELLATPGRINRTPGNGALINKIVKDVIERIDTSAPFYIHYRYSAKAHPHRHLSVRTASGETIPLRGLGAALAVANFIYDDDCIGGAGGNIGYVIEPDTSGQPYAKTVKIDTGNAFSFLTKEGKAGRNIKVGAQMSPLGFEELNEPDKAEFTAMAKHILAAPWHQIEELVHRFKNPEGLPDYRIQELLEKLLARKKDFLNAFSSEVDIHLRREVQQEREAALLRWATLPPSSPILTSHEKTVEGKDERGPGWMSHTSTVLPTSSTHSPAISSVESKSSSSALITSSLKGLDDKEQATQHLRLLLQGMLPTEQKEAKASVVRTFQLSPVTAHFTGRDTLLTQLADTLSRQHGGVISQAISGLGGIGKTQLAARYAELAQQGAHLGAHHLAYDAVIWLYAERDLSNQFTVLAQSWFGIQGSSSDEIRKKLHLQLQHQRVLMVFDNATDASDLTPYLDTFKGGHYHILITSRQADWQAIPTLRLTGFSPAEGQAYVQKYLPEAKTEEITSLLDTVAFLPLALSHAVAYIREKYCTLSEYPRVFALHQLSLKPSLTVSDTGQTVMTTFLLTVRRLTPSFPEVEAILQAAAYLAPDAIPLDFLWQGIQQTHGTAYAESRLAASLAALVQHSLVQHDNTRQTVSLHRLVQGAICAYHAHKEGAEGVQRHVIAWAEYSVKKLKYSEKDSGDALRVSAFIPHAWALVSTLQQHEVMGKIQTLRVLLQRIGDHQMYGIGAYREGQKAYAAELAWVEKHYPADHHGVAITLMNLGNALLELGDAQGAKPLLERALTIDEKHYPADHPQIAITLTNLGNTLHQLGDAQGAKSLLERALTIKEKHYPADHPQVAITLTNLGSILRGLGDAQGAKPLFERALMINEKHYPPGHLEIAITLGNLGVILRGLGDALGAKPLQERALTTEEKHYPADHPQVARALGNLGMTLLDLGDAPGAKPLLERALTIEEKHYPVDHPQVARTLTNLGITLFQLGDAPGAKPLLERALTIKEKHYPTDHPQVASTLVNLSITLHQLGDTPGAKKHLTRAHQILLSQFGATHPDTQRVARMLKKLEVSHTIPAVRESKPLTTPALSSHPATLRASTSSSSRSSAPTPQRRSDRCVIS